MSEEQQEGWDAPFRAPLIATAAVLTALLGGVVVAGSYYRAHMQRATHAPVMALHRMPYPRLETLQTAPGEHRPAARPLPADAIGKAMAETAAQGDALWQRARP